MFTKETAKKAIDECFTLVNLFREEHDGRAGDTAVRVCIAGVDGGGLSTYGKSALISHPEEFECKDAYLRIIRRNKTRDFETRYRMVTDEITFVPYEHIVSIGCSPSAAI